jgi:hypothetical protein
MPEPQPLNIFWWNTALFPPTLLETRGSADQALVISQIKLLRESHRFALFGLGEVCGSNLEAILEGVGDPTLGILDATGRRGKVILDTAFLYDRLQLEPVDNCVQEIQHRAGKTALKLGIMTKFRVPAVDCQIHVVASHWPGRLRSATAPDRLELASALRTHCVQVGDTGVQHIVLMGDYNEDPASPALETHLRATRDRTLAQRDSAFTYNPFWRSLGESHALGEAAEIAGICGTHYYRRGRDTRWMTLDQMIFSSAFLHDGPLTLNEQETGIVSNAALRQALLSNKSFCDHLPVRGQITIRNRVHV